MKRNKLKKSVVRDSTLRIGVFLAITPWREFLSRTKFFGLCSNSNSYDRNFFLFFRFPFLIKASVPVHKLLYGIFNLTSLLFFVSYLHPTTLPGLTLEKTTPLRIQCSQSLVYVQYQTCSYHRWAMPFKRNSVCGLCVQNRAPTAKST